MTQLGGKCEICSQRNSFETMLIIRAKTVEQVQNNTLGAGTKEAQGIIAWYPSSSAYGSAGGNDLC
jgi:hypothetical protein